MVVEPIPSTCAFKNKATTLNYKSKSVIEYNWPLGWSEGQGTNRVNYKCLTQRKTHLFWNQGEIVAYNSVPGNTALDISTHLLKSDVWAFTTVNLTSHHERIVFYRLKKKLQLEVFQHYCRSLDIDILTKTVEKLFYKNIDRISSKLVPRFLHSSRKLAGVF